MSKVALSTEQIAEINSFLDAELASVGDENSVFIGSTYSTKNSFHPKNGRIPCQTSPPNLNHHHLGHNLSLGDSALKAQKAHETSPMLEIDRAEILSTENVLELQDKIDELEKRMVNYTGVRKQPRRRRKGSKLRVKGSAKKRRKSRGIPMDVIYKGKKIKTIREYSFDNERPVKRRRKRSV